MWTLQVNQHGQRPRGRRINTCVGTRVAHLEVRGNSTFSWRVAVLLLNGLETAFKQADVPGTSPSLSQRCVGLNSHYKKPILESLKIIFGLLICWLHSAAFLFCLCASEAGNRRPSCHHSITFSFSTEWHSSQHKHVHKCFASSYKKG